MTCAEFQRVLPYIIETGGDAEQEAHLKSCQVCSDLVQDLRYIAEAAKLLVPMEEPNSRVWEGIEKSLEREGLVRPAGPGRRLLSPGAWGTVPWVLAVTTIVVVVAVTALILHQNYPTHSLAQPPAASMQTDDQQLLAAVGQESPEVRSIYEANLRRVNAFIADATRLVQRSPGDADARHFLMEAYEQKDVLYRMAMAHTR